MIYNGHFVSQMHWDLTISFPVGIKDVCKFLDTPPIKSGALFALHLTWAGI